MSSHFPPLTYKEIICILNNLGFDPLPLKGTAHQHWIKQTENGKLKVTVSIHLSPYSQTLIRYMAQQAGISKKEFYAALNRKHKKDKPMPTQNLSKVAELEE